MDWATKRRIKYAVGAVCVLVALVLIIYGFTREAATCSDLKQNQGELGVDCGGPCAKVCNTEAQKIRVIWSRAFEISAGKYDAAARIVNSNKTLGMRVMKYSFKFYDDADKLILDKKSSTYLNPDEDFILVLPNIDTGSRVISRTEFSVTEENWERVILLPAIPRFVIEDKKTEYDGGIFRLSARLTNKSYIDVPDGVEVSALAYDDSGNIIAVSSSAISAVSRAETKEIYFTWPVGNKVANANIFDIVPRVNDFQFIGK